MYNFRSDNTIVTKGLKGQVLVTTILVLMLIALTVLAITSTVQSSTSNVSNNLNYSRSYNLAETVLLQNSQALSTPYVDISEINRLLSDDLSCDFDVTNGGLLCTKDEVERKSIVKIFETKYVENFEIYSNEYFDVILSDNFNGSFTLDWVGSTAIELSLLYEHNGELEQITEVIDPNGRYSEPVNGSQGFLLNLSVIDNSAVIDLNSGNVINIPNRSEIEFRKVRVKIINDNFGSSITIKPSSNASSFPNQVRRVEIINYSKENPTSPAAVVFSQFPLSPMLPAPTTFADTFAAVKSPVCGNGVVEGGETCDDDDPNCQNCAINITVPVERTGDCVTLSCYSHPEVTQLANKYGITFYVKSVNVTILEGGDDRGCISGPAGSTSVFAIEGDVCGQGRLRGTITCSSIRPTNISKRLNGKKKVYYPNGRGIDACIEAYGGDNRSEN